MPTSYCLLPTPCSLLIRLGADEHRSAALGTRVLGEHAQAARHFLVSLEHPSEVTAETVLVQLVGGGCVPEPAAVRADLVGEHDAHLLVLPEPTELHLEVDKAD